MQINWDNFKTYNQDSRGVRYKFEDLCRQLFANENLSENKQFRYLHANPNNYGLETEPIYDEVNQQWIGFQAKFFDGDVDYSQIKHSAEKTVEYYTGKAGIVNLVYLYSNKPITATSKSYTEIINLFKANNIEIQLVTDNAILDLVRVKYPYLGLYYFGNHTISQNWFATQTRYMFDELGERFNREFNVGTIFETELALFIHDQIAVDYLNKRKEDLCGEIDRLYRNETTHREYLRSLKAAANNLPDVTIETLYSAIDWCQRVEEAIKSFLDGLRKSRQKLIEERKKAYEAGFGGNETKEERSVAIKRYRELEDKIGKYDTLIEFPEMLSVTERERQLLHGNVLTLFGRAGTGKTQLIASTTKRLLDADRTALLLVAGIYLASDPIQEQIMKNLRLDYSFEELLDILETIGERENQIVPVFIDAINETWNRKLWKTGLQSIVDKINGLTMVKLVISYRPEYEKLLLPEMILGEKQEGGIISMYHRGFEDNSTIAVREFLDHHNIPFTPLEYFSTEMSNPLFLTLYCKTYDGTEVSLPELYERIIKLANSNIYKALEKDLSSKGYTEEDDLVGPLITQIAEYLVSHDERVIAKSDLVKLSFWLEYGLIAASFVSHLVKEHILHDSQHEEKETYYFAYDQMNDYYCAKSIVEKFSSKDDLRKHLSEHVLGIHEGALNHSWNIDLFVNACALYAKKFNEECIDIIDALNDRSDQWEVFSKYIDSFQWRDKRTISKDYLYDVLRKYPCSPEELWTMLIGNSVKVHHPLNADFLHEFLSSYELNRRDYLWTIYINKLPIYESDRLVQLIQMYDRGEKLDVKDEKQIELMLTLFGWLLTSSNRWLRDYTSKAMVEIFKDHFDLCQAILEKFDDVNDPYVIQRLYGVVFGACSKRHAGSIQTLAEYVYNRIFNQEKVYPDILLRDYARLIIERFLYEEPDYSGIIDRQKIVPPYNSDPVPEIEDQHYLEKKYDGGMFWLMHSMRFEGMGMYGDFGRYVFQSALRSFDIDDKQIFNYAVYYILNELGYREDLFSEHDKHCGSYDRNLTSKTERIGKKYQWITMYNFLARISDNCKMVDRWSYPEKQDGHFEGAWEPYVRDFDPTLNKAFMECKDAPIFKQLEDHVSEGVTENKTADISSPEAEKAWLETRGVFLEQLKETLILTDDNGAQWVSLTKYCDTGRKDLNVEKLLVWSWLYAYFVTPEQEALLSGCVEKGLPVLAHNLASHNETYVVFNREYPWSPSCKELKEYAWVDAQLKTGEYETVTESYQVPDYSFLDALLRKYRGETDDEEIPDDLVLLEEDKDHDDENLDDEISEIQYRKETHRREIEKPIGRILHSTTDLLWEEEYDATKEDAISHSVPCARLIEEMGLRQLKYDGFFYDSEGKLAAFDTDLTQQVNSVVVRKDILDAFLEKTGMKLVWIVQAEKEIHVEDYSIAYWSEGEAVFTYEREGISGEIKQLRKQR